MSKHFPHSDSSQTSFLKPPIKSFFIVQGRILPSSLLRKLKMSNACFLSFPLYLSHLSMFFLVFAFSFSSLIPFMRVRPFIFHKQLCRIRQTDSIHPASMTLRMESLSYVQVSSYNLGLCGQTPVTSITVSPAESTILGMLQEHRINEASDAAICQYHLSSLLD